MASTSKASRSKRAKLLKLNLQNLRQYYDEPVADYLARAKTMADCLVAIVDDPVDLVVCVILGLRSDLKWELHTTLMARAESHVTTFSDLYFILVAHEAILQKNKAETSSPRLTAGQRLRKAVESLCRLRISPRGNQSSGGHNGNGIKRIRDDSYNYQLKRPFGSTCGESSGQQQSPRGGGCSSAQKKQKPRPLDALRYLKNVQDTFRENKDKYGAFLDLLEDFKDKRIDTACVVQRVKDLFKQHNDLLIGFSVFLSDDINIDVSKI